MPDIAMCADHECPAREGCYRYKATPDPYYQAYGEFNRGGMHYCRYFWPMKINEKPKEADHAE